MLVKPINLVTVRSNQEQKKRQTTFGNAGNPVITLMDSIDRGGFAASFILQDFLGMAAPRIGTGMFRNYDKTGKLNTDFAKKEGVREILSGPSAFLIPAGMMYGIKKVSGSANNVPVDFIGALGDTFADYAGKNKETLGNLAKSKQEVYAEYFKNIISSSTNHALGAEELNDTAASYANRLIEAEKAPSKGFWKTFLGKPVSGSAQDLKQGLKEDYIALLKKHNGANGNKLVAQYETSAYSKVATSFGSLLNYMKDYTDDALKQVGKKLEKSKNFDAEKFVNNLNKRRSGTRILSNLGMLSAVIGFYTIIPKLYNKVTNGRDPGLDGLENANKTNDLAFLGKENNDKEPQQVSFTGGMNTLQKAAADLGTTVKKSSGLHKLSNLLEFEGASMSMPSMLTVLFGFCLPPRLINAQSATDRKEILFRDVTSFLSILFGAKMITRVFSDAFAKKSGLALNTKPADHKENLLKRAWHYIYPSGGVNVLDSQSIVANYSEVENFKNGISDMFKFVNDNGGNVGKMLSIDPEIAKNAGEILGQTPNSKMKYKNIVKAFEDAKGTKAYENIVKTLSDKNNPLVKKAKTLNSAFGFASTVFLVPALMIWISKHCEKMTKQRIAEEQKELQLKNARINHAIRVLSSKPTMEGFLKSGVNA